MKWTVAWMTLVLAGCAGVPAVGEHEQVFADAAFPVSPDAVRGDDLFVVTPAMREYLAQLVRRGHRADRRRALVEAMRGDLRLEYEGARTLTAAEAFAARSGNCLSLAVLAGALARELGITVHYQRVLGVDTWSRQGGLAVRNGHVNLTLVDSPIARPGVTLPPAVSDDLIIDFVPRINAPTQAIDEATVRAMYLNNRAAEILADGDAGRAYWWARDAIRTDPAFGPAYNTLALVYRHAGRTRDAERALRHALEREPDNAVLLTNLAALAAAGGRDAEAALLRARLARLEPYPPFHFLDEGRAALARGDAAAALALFRRELRRMPYNDEVHFAVALAALRLGDRRDAQRHLALALDNSTTRQRRDLYAAKLNHLRGSSAN